jgi:hypothetical protein
MTKNYRKTAIQPMYPWTPDISMCDVSVSAPDRENGSPETGDMIAVNPKRLIEQWLVAKAFFEENYEETGNSDGEASDPRDRVTEAIEAISLATALPEERIIAELTGTAWTEEEACQLLRKFKDS